MEQPVSDYEAQLNAMRLVMEALKPLEREAREAVLSWVDSQFGRTLSKEGYSKSAQPDKPPQTPPQREGTVSLVAQKLGSKSARDLLLAAAVHLTLFQMKDRFSRAELIACAKDARGWKAEYSNQMAINIKRMHDAGTLIEKAKDVFSVSDQALADSQQRLGT